MKNIIDKVKQSGRNILIAGSLASCIGLYGCDTVNYPQGSSEYYANQSETASAAAGAAAGWAMLSDDPNIAIAGATAANAANMIAHQSAVQAQQAMKNEIIQEMRNENERREQNNLQTVPQTHYIPENVVRLDNGKVRKLTPNEEFFFDHRDEKKLFFTCNYFKDFNNNGKIGIDEYINIKSSFGKNEKITAIASIDYDIYGQTVIKELLNNNGNTIKLQKEYINLHYSGPVIDFVIEPNELQTGKYVVTFSAEKEYLGKVEFEITD